MTKTTIKELNLDKSKWKKVKFGDVVAEPKESTKNAAAEGIEHVVGLEHIDTENIHLRRSASIEEETTFTKVFRKGDVLFGRRRAYLKKAAQASFDGICSGDITVFRTNEKLLSELLPFVVNNDKFFDFAVEHSAGGLSPRVKFKDLANYEFLLPPKAQQGQLAELLWAGDEMVEKETSLITNSRSFYESKKEELALKGFKKETCFSKKIKKDIAKKWKVLTIGDLVKNGAILKIQDGNHGEIHPKSKDYVDKGIPFIMANSITDNGELDLEKSKKLPLELTNNLRIGFSKPGDVLLSHKGTIGQCTIVPDKINSPYLMLTPQVTYYRVNQNKISNKFLFYVFTSKYFKDQLERLSSQSTRAYIGITSQRKLKLVIPESFDEQLEIVGRLDFLNISLNSIETKIKSSKALQKSLINQIF